MKNKNHTQSEAEWRHKLRVVRLPEYPGILFAAEDSQLFWAMQRAFVRMQQESGKQNISASPVYNSGAARTEEYWHKLFQDYVEVLDFVDLKHRQQRGFFKALHTAFLSKYDNAAPESTNFELAGGFEYAFQAFRKRNTATTSPNDGNRDAVLAEIKERHKSDASWALSAMNRGGRAM
ncbi:unnamed protein product [Amoebophrya sp. A120]|nr:unnamed protein product [Amoebophrya sp. A120]|eukprot:GSA120T00015757001.1